MFNQKMKPSIRRFIIGALMVLASIFLFSFGLLMSMFSMAAAGEGIAFFYFMGVVALIIFILGFRLIHLWAREWKDYRISQIQSTTGPEAVSYRYPEIAILPGGPWRWIIVSVVSILLMLMSRKVGYTYFLVVLLLVDGIYCACVRMLHCFLVDAVAFFFGAGYLAHAAFCYFLPKEIQSGSEIYRFAGDPSGLRIFSIVIALLLFHGSLSLWEYWRTYRKKVSSS